jgi:hypothetical protein
MCVSARRAQAASSVSTASRNEITLKGSVEIVTEFFGCVGSGRGRAGGWRARGAEWRGSGG